jgi:hypothetical protein
MQTTKVCPTCGARHQVEIRHEWPTVDGRRTFEVVLTSQSSKYDAGKLESLCPRADDGQVLVATAEWVGEDSVLLRVNRQPQPSISATGVSNVPPTKASRAEMLTEAAELGLKTDPKWKDIELAAALAKHKKSRQPVEA